ncbi:MAG: hypothetical protein ACE5G1_00470 [bacterium]
MFQRISQQLILLLGVLWSWQAIASDDNFTLPIEEIEQKLTQEDFEVSQMRGSRFKGDLTKRALLKFPDGWVQVKWKRSNYGGEAPNNQPRYEVAAYELQKLFLDPEDYVVPPTSVRCLPVTQYQRIESFVDPTFNNTNYVFFVLQYWLENVSNRFEFDKKRYKKDETYAKYVGNLNIFSYLIKHADSNVGNFLISKNPSAPRVFAVDNGLAFGRLQSDKGYEWQDLQVKRLPKETVERLRNITLEKLTQQVAVVAQFENKDGHMVLVAPTANLNEKRGVRNKDGVVQFGLTSNEIKQVYRRLQKLLKRVDDGKIETF